MNQKELFVNGEGNRYFAENLDFELKQDLSTDVLGSIVTRLLIKPKSVMEFGCSSGYRLSLLKDIFQDCRRFVGIEASEKAVAYGKSKFGLELYCGDISARSGGGGFLILSLI